MKKIIALIVLVLVVAGAYLFMNRPAAAPAPSDEQKAADEAPVATSTAAAPVDENPAQTVIGRSAGGRDIVAYHYGAATGTELLLVGGVHGGYSWNTAKVAYQAKAHLDANPSLVPDGARVTVVPVLNPDGLAKVLSASTTGDFDAAAVNKSEAARVAGRFNGNGVDLNRNFDCDWQAEGTWQTKKVDGGDAAFSEPEAQAIRGYIESHDIALAVVWYSSAGGVFASNCHGGVLPETASALRAFADASGYKAHEELDFYEVTGDLTNWLAKRGTPAFSVLLTDHENTEWEKNRKGLEALLAELAS